MSATDNGADDLVIHIDPFKVAPNRNIAGSGLGRRTPPVNAK
jgi:hypothetical protein